MFCTLQDQKARSKPYDKQSLLRAFEATRTGVSVYRAARMYSVPESTLRDRTRGIVSLDGTRGPDTLLSHSEEQQLVDHISYMASIGYGYTKSNIQFMAAEFARSLGKKLNGDKALSHNWFYGFLKRWPDLKVVKPQKLNIARAKSASDISINQYFKELEEILLSKGIKNTPERIFNIDETGVSTEHTPPKIVCSKSVNPQAVTSSRSANITIIAAASATGNHVPPFYVFPGKRWSDQLLQGAPAGSAGTVSDKGWSNSEVFEDYLKNHFSKHVLLSDAPNQPATLLLYDGHKSHLTLTLADWARQRNVILFVLPPHTSHLTQPLDVGVFGPFKNHYYKECQFYLQKNPGISITRYEVAQLTARPYMKAFSPENITSAFRKSGIYPFNRDKITPDQVAPATIYKTSHSDPPEDTCNNVYPDGVKLPDAQDDKYNASKTAVDSETKPSPATVISGVEKGHFFQTRTIYSVVKKPKKRFVPPYAVSGNLTNQTNYDILTKQATKKEKSAPKVTKTSVKQQQTTKTSVKQDSVVSSVAAGGPKASTSGTNNRGGPISLCSPARSEESTVDSIADEDLCCLCKKYEPEQLREYPGLVIVKWGKCDFCEHWTHLTFCSDVRVLRRGSIFRCPHCTDEE